MIAITPENSEWYTPNHILNAVYETLETVDLDPCCNVIGSPVVKAEKYYRLPEQDGLKESWSGNVFMNSPYGREIPKWTKKLLKEYLFGDVRSAIALIPVKAGAKWWHMLQDFSCCWCSIEGRIKFLEPGGNTRKTGTFSSAAVLLTRDYDTETRFYDSFSEMGQIWELRR